MSEDGLALLGAIAFIGLAFALVYSPWPKSKKYREQEAIAKRHYDEYVRASAAFQIPARETVDNS